MSPRWAKGAVIMKRIAGVMLVLGVLVAAAAMSGSQQGPPTARFPDFQVTVEERNPWSHLRLNNDQETFRFAIISDRTGGHRAQIFSQAVERLNLMQPEFVMSVGDLIEGYTDDKDKLAGEWKEFQTYISQLQMPFFYVPGNHDVSKLGEKTWKEKFGRRYYHFVYKNVLFLMLCADDPNARLGRISDEQIAFVKKTLEDNKAVQWTIVALHRPLWTEEPVEKNGWLQVEQLLADRPYTVFCGHIHVYRKFVRNGRNYYQLATTGGASRVRGVRYGEFDHFVWVTMKKDGPVLANVLLDGVYPENMKNLATEETGVYAANRKPTHPVRGKVFFEGTPAANAQVVFYLISNAGKNFTYAGDALVDADGSFTLTTYTANDGAPVGEYAVTITNRDPMWDEQGKPGPNRLPARYGRPQTSGLRAKVEEGANEYTFELKK
jgi:3',5'-cyclic AMP phosphodiesterase CpdA